MSSFLKRLFGPGYPKEELSNKCDGPGPQRGETDASTFESWLERAYKALGLEQAWKEHRKFLRWNGFLSALVGALQNPGETLTRQAADQQKYAQNLRETLKPNLAALAGELKLPPLVGHLKTIFLFVAAGGEAAILAATLISIGEDRITAWVIGVTWGAIVTVGGYSIGSLMRKRDAGVLEDGKIMSHLPGAAVALCVMAGLISGAVRSSGYSGVMVVFGFSLVSSVFAGVSIFSSYALLDPKADQYKAQTARVRAEERKARMLGMHPVAVAFGFLRARLEVEAGEAWSAGNIGMASAGASANAMKDNSAAVLGGGEPLEPANPTGASTTDSDPAPQTPNRRGPTVFADALADPPALPASPEELADQAAATNRTERKRLRAVLSADPEVIKSEAAPEGNAGSNGHAPQEKVERVRAELEEADRPFRPAPNGNH